jgi:hypothetical protein
MRIFATRLARFVVVSLMVSALAGCFPMVTRYTQLDGPEVEHRSSLCPTYGPPGKAAMKAGEVEVQLNLNPSGVAKQGSLSVVGPLDSRLALGEAELKIMGEGQTKVQTVPLTLLPPYVNPFAKNFKRTRNVQFYAFPIPADLADAGTVEVPTIKINDAIVPPRTLRFSRKTWVGTMPLNC